jgi:hypothetical protein
MKTIESVLEALRSKIINEDETEDLELYQRCDELLAESSNPAIGEMLDAEMETEEDAV